MEHRRLSVAGKVCASTTSASVCQATQARIARRKQNAQKTVAIMVFARMVDVIVARHSVDLTVIRRMLAQMGAQSEEFV